MFMYFYIFLFIFIFKIIVVKYLSIPHILPTFYIFILMNFVTCIGMEFKSRSKDKFY